MSSRILLINFTNKEADKLKDLPLVVDRGYLSDVISTSDRAFSDTKEEPLNYYFPHSIYEYKIIYLNLNKNEEIELEFESRANAYPKNKWNEFYNFYMKKGVLVVFLGDYDYSRLFNLGILAVNLNKVTDNDITSYYTQKKDTSFKKTLEGFCSQIIMPTKQYIYIKEEYYEMNSNDFAMKVIYRNLGEEILGCYHNNKPKFSDEDRPNFIILPQFRNNTLVIKRLTKELTKIYKNLLPEIYEPDWIDSEKYYPREIGLYNEERKELLENIKTKIADLSEAKEEAKKKYKFLRGLLDQTGNELKTAVIDVLSNIFKVKVTDSDEIKEESLLDEDIIIELNERKILAEIKGDGSENPTPRHISQVWKHLHRSKDKSIEEGALILNYDWKTEPEDRKMAYTGELEKDLADIIFIDTRVMFNLAIAIIDFSMQIEKADNILFQKGRVSFDLEEYIASKPQ